MTNFCPGCQDGVADPGEYQCTGCGYYRPGAGWPVDELLGQTIGDGRYALEARIGVGSFAAVYRASDATDDCAVAIKVLEAAKATENKIRKNFEAEAKALRVLQHPNIVSCRASGLIDGFRPYIVLDLVEGASLQDEIFPSRASAPTPMDPVRAIKIAMQMASALAFAHDQKLLHRDLNPNNVMLINERGNDFVKIIDLGIAKILGKNTVDRVTRHIAGTPDFMAPEQFTPGKVLDARLDLWQLGAVLHFALTGFPPYPPQDNLGEMLLHMRQIVSVGEDTLGPRPSDQVATLGQYQALDDLVASLLAPHTVARPADANEVLVALRSARSSARRVSQPSVNDATKVVSLSEAPSDNYCPGCQASVGLTAALCDECARKRPEGGWPEDTMLGRTIGHGRFAILRRLSAQSYGDTYLVKDKQSDADRALTIVNRPGFASQVHQLVIGPLASLSRVSHSNLVGCLEAGKLSDLGCPFVLTETVAGTLLFDLVWRPEHRLPSTVDPLDTISVGMQLCAAIAELHQSGFRHGTINPRTIILGSNGQVKLGHLISAPLTEALTSTQTVEDVGYVDYMAPEQLKWDESATYQSDFWQLGAVLHFLLTGWSPYPADERNPLILQNTQHMLRQQLAVAEYAGPTPSRRVPSLRAFAKLDRIVSELLSTRPEVRPPSAHAISHRLHEAVTELS